MELLERPRNGVHFTAKDIHVSADELEKVVKGIDQAGLSDFLATNPVEMRYVPGLTNTEGKLVTGAYNRKARRVRLNSSRPSNTFGQGLQEGTSYTVSQSGKSIHEAMRMTLVHELGHHLVNVGGEAVDAIIETAFLTPGKKPISVYARGNPEDYFCESLAAYTFHHDRLKDYDENGYKMVQDVRAMMGLKP